MAGHHCRTYQYQESLVPPLVDDPIMQGWFDTKNYETYSINIVVSDKEPYDVAYITGSHQVIQWHVLLLYGLFGFNQIFELLFFDSDEL